MPPSPETNDKQTPQFYAVGSNSPETEKTNIKNGVCKPISVPSSAESITIIHFNDCYNIEPGPKSSGAAGFLTAVNQFRHLEPIILFSGDIISPSFMSTFTKGEQMIPVLNDIGVDCAVFGNHEFDYGVDNLVEFCRKTTFPWLLSNVIDKETSNQLGDGLIYHIIERSGLKFGLIGLIEEEWLSTLSTVDTCDVIYQDFVARGQELARLLKSDPHRVDYVIALTHFRTPNDIKLADAVSDIDIILGGHDHDYEIIKRPNCYIVKSGTDFREFSLITLKVNPSYKSINRQQQTNRVLTKARDKEYLPTGIEKGINESDGFSSNVGSKSILEVDIKRIDCSQYKQDEALKKKLEKFVSTIDEKMGKVLGQFNCELDGRFSSIRRSETNLGNFVTDIMVASTHADLAILNSGTLRSDRIHPRGDFTMRDLFNILGYIDPIAVLEATGQQIWEALENGVSQWPKLEGRFPQVGGCSFAFDPDKPALQRINPHHITIGEEPLVLDKTYKLTTKAYLASGKDGYDVLKKCRVLVPGDESPDLTTSILNHFEAINIVKSNRRTHHRQSIICLSRSSIKKLRDHSNASTIDLDSSSPICSAESNTDQVDDKITSVSTEQQKERLQSVSYTNIGNRKVLKQQPNVDHSANLFSHLIARNEKNEDGADILTERQNCDKIDNHSNHQTSGYDNQNHRHQINTQQQTISRRESTNRDYQISQVSQSILFEQDNNNNSDNRNDLNHIGNNNTHSQHSQLMRSTSSTLTPCLDEDSEFYQDPAVYKKEASPITSPSLLSTDCRTKGIQSSRPRTNRIMSIYEMEHETCKLEPKIEGRIRILRSDC